MRLPVPAGATDAFAFTPCPSTRLAPVLPPARVRGVVDAAVIPPDICSAVDEVLVIETGAPVPKVTRLSVTWI